MATSSTSSLEGAGASRGGSPASSEMTIGKEANRIWNNRPHIGIAGTGPHLVFCLDARGMIESYK